MPDQQAIWGDKLTIETPEQTAFDFPLAGIGSRGLALLLDTLLQITGFSVLILILVFFNTAVTALSNAMGTWATALAIFAAFTIYYGYFAIFEALWNGQTPGKRWIKLRVIDESGRPVSVQQAILRNLIRFIDQLPSMYAVGLISALISKQNRRLGDFVASTVVVHERPLEKTAMAWGMRAEPVVNPMMPAAELPQPSAAALSGLALTLDEWRLVETFLQRRASLDFALRDKLARDIVLKLNRRLNFTYDQMRAAGFSSNEAYLEALARSRPGWSSGS
ncbi:MAG TPA: RDD family protein [Candidatus Acidoferrales bacterium]|nr:RDD family protein [Candidatus Acidoferrales bacterium]